MQEAMFENPMLLFTLREEFAKPTLLFSLALEAPPVALAAIPVASPRRIALLNSDGRVCLVVLDVGATGVQPVLGTAVGAPRSETAAADREAIGGAVAANARMLVAGTWASRHVDVFAIEGLVGLSHLRTVDLGLLTGSHLAWHMTACASSNTRVGTRSPCNPNRRVSR